MRSETSPAVCLTVCPARWTRAQCRSVCRRCSSQVAPTWATRSGHRAISLPCSACGQKTVSVVAEYWYVSSAATGLQCASFAGDMGTIVVIRAGVDATRSTADVPPRPRSSQLLTQTIRGPRARGLAPSRGPRWRAGPRNRAPPRQPEPQNPPSSTPPGPPPDNQVPRVTAPTPRSTGLTPVAPPWPTPGLGCGQRAERREPTARDPRGQMSVSSYRRCCRLAHGRTMKITGVGRWYRRFSSIGCRSEPRPSRMWSLPCPCPGWSAAARISRGFGDAQVGNAGLEVDAAAGGRPVLRIVA